MADKKVRLNLGSGSIYKPGYVNIDKFDSVADKVVDVCDLPYESNTVESIEASQLVEHFDYIHCKYVLSEWFRVLKTGGTLILETPDLEKTFKKFISADIETQKTTLQWIYGIDSPGMRHKTGFTVSLLKNLLKETGFDEVRMEEQRTHRYEPGMRVVCKKPTEHSEKQFLASFRKRLKKRLGVDDSYLLIPLEDWIKKIGGFSVNKQRLDEVISETVLCSPVISLVFLEECLSSGLVEESQIKDKIDLLNHLAEKEFHKRVFSLWMKSRKKAEIEKEFNEFIKRIKSTIMVVLNEGGDDISRLDYILSLEPSEIEFFDFNLIIQKAEKLFNLGVKHFHRREFSESMDYFTESSKINSSNPLVYWNIARLSCTLGFEKHAIDENYEKALSLIKDKKGLMEEAGYIRGNRTDLIPSKPVTVDDLTHERI